MAFTLSMLEPFFAWNQNEYYLSRVPPMNNHCRGVNRVRSRLDLDLDPLIIIETEAGDNDRVTCCTVPPNANTLRIGFLQSLWGYLADTYNPYIIPNVDRANLPPGKITSHSAGLNDFTVYTYPVSPGPRAYLTGSIYIQRDYVNHLIAYTYGTEDPGKVELRCTFGNPKDYDMMQIQDMLNTLVVLNKIANPNKNPEPRTQTLPPIIVGA